MAAAALHLRRMTGVDSDATECEIGGGLKDEAPASFTGTKRFVAHVMGETIQSARYVADYARKYPRLAGHPVTRYIDEKLLNGCAAWVWMNGQGSRDFTFEECSWALGWDPDWVREKVMAPYGDPRDINTWVKKRADSLGPLWGD